MKLATILAMFFLLPGSTSCAESFEEVKAGPIQRKLAESVNHTAVSWWYAGLDDEYHYIVEKWPMEQLRYKVRKNSVHVDIEAPIGAILKRRRLDKIENDRYQVPIEVSRLASRLDYNYLRTYDPSTGRYLGSDPIGLGGGLNTFGYGCKIHCCRFAPNSDPVFAIKIGPAEWSETQRMSPSGGDQTGQSWMKIGTRIGSNFSANQHARMLRGCC